MKAKLFDAIIRHLVHAIEDTTRILVVIKKRSFLIFFVAMMHVQNLPAIHIAA